MDLAPGSTLGGYTVVAPLGRGGMGAVYSARREDGALVALKVLLATTSEPARLRFTREAELAARLDHPGIVRVHAAGVDRGRPFIAMELVEGRSLAELVGRVEPALAAALAAEVARAIQHAHARGVLHRDLKPANVLVRTDGRAVVT